MQYRLIQIQAVTGLIFFVYVVLHLGNTALAALSPGLYDGAQRFLRHIYQNPVLEPCFVLAISAHIGIGLYRIVSGRSAASTLRKKLHRYAGLFLAFAIFGHVLAVRGPSFVEGIFPGFAGVSFTLAKAPIAFGLYYFVFANAAVLHALNGARIAAQRVGIPLMIADRAMIRIFVFGAIVFAFALAGFAGLMYDIGDPFDNPYAVFMEKYM